MIKIYKVRYLDVTGREVAEFGFYESRSDAMRRWQEVQPLVKMPGRMDIREITVVPDTEKNMESEHNIDIYDFKKNS